MSFPMALTPHLVPSLEAVKYINDVPDSEWTEESVLALIERLIPPTLERNQDVLFNRLPERCKTYNVWREASAKCPTCLRLVPASVATQSFYEDVVNLNGQAIREVPRQFRTSELCCIATDNSQFSILSEVPYESQTEEMILADIEFFDGESLMWAAFQTRDICIAAVKSIPTTIELVKDQTLEVCENAIQAASERNDGDKTLHEVVALIKNHTPEICNIVLRHHPWSIARLRNHSREVCLTAIHNTDPVEVSLILNDIREQTLEICIAAYRKSRESYRAVHNPVLRRNMIRTILASDVIPLHGADLSTSLLTEICEHLLPEKFPPVLWEKPQLLTPSQLWSLAAKVKHAA